VAELIQINLRRAGVVSAREDAMTATPARAQSPRSVSIALTGSGGTGVMTAGAMLLEAAARAGYYGLMSRSSGPQIRGGEAAALIRVADRPIEGHDDRFDLLLSVDWVNLERFAAEIPLDAASIVIGDPGQGEPPAAMVAAAATRLDLPMKDIAKKIPGGRPNMVALGYVASLVGLPAAAVAEAVRRTLGAESDRLPASLAAMEAGREAAPGAACPHRLPPALPRQERWLITGNEAAGYGALRGGVRFVAAYPITPATEMLEWMSPALSELGGVLVQAEDELASINMAIGASYGGTPSLTATSGPGLSLMTEALGLAVAAEIPLVVVDVMRTGPSTGVPTKSEQSDLNIALYGMHGDAPHVVVAPNSVADCLATTEWAVHLAEAMQVPVLVLSDQSMGQTRITVDPPAQTGAAARRLLAQADGEPYRRYALTPSGISPMAIPGMAGLMYTADGLEHSERGTPSSQAKDHLAQLDKRQRKLTAVDVSPRWAEIEGEGEIAIVTWGSCTGPAREAIARAGADGRAVKLVSLRLLAPAQPALLAAALAGVKRVLVVEQTHGGQFHRYLRAEHALAAEIRSLRRPGPLPLRPGEIHHELMRWSRS
jgi:2-oxoglutarate/2-oxoacid ferredoxin oxidoreductase subunit alpha